MVTIDNQTTLLIDQERISTIASHLTSRDIDLIICDNTTIRNYNRKYRNKDKSTDVLSFPLEGSFEHMPLGSIVISAEHVIDKAKKFKHSEKDELDLLFIHGLLHLLGYDHECDGGKMRAKEERLIKKFDLPKSLIVRTEKD